MRTARLVGRRKRFLMDVEADEGPFTAHTNNTGSMLGLLRPGSEVLLSVSDSPTRKHACTVEAVRLGGFWVGVNTAM
ncbi:MAG: sugar fermentation stimulation protein SfsA, partial [Acidobacteriota bacterium]